MFAARCFVSERPVPLLQSVVELQSYWEDLKLLKRRSEVTKDRKGLKETLLI